MSYKDIPDETARLLKELGESLDFLAEGPEGMTDDPRGGAERRILELCEYILHRASLGIEGTKLILPILNANLDTHK